MIVGLHSYPTIYHICCFRNLAIWSRRSIGTKTVPTTWWTLRGWIWRSFPISSTCTGTRSTWRKETAYSYHSSKDTTVFLWLFIFFITCLLNIHHVKLLKRCRKHTRMSQTSIANGPLIDLTAVYSKVPFLLTFYVPNLGSRTQNMTSLAF